VRGAREEAERAAAVRARACARSAAQRVSARGARRLLRPPSPAARADKFMLIDQIGAIDFLKPMIAVLFANKAAAAAAAAGAGGAPPPSRS
jgi:hypothetical protein